MKNVVTWGLAVLLPCLVPTAHALVVDQFRCSIQGVDKAGNVLFSSESEPYAVRVPNSDGVTSDAHLSISVAGPKGYAAELELSYRHGIQYDVGAIPLRAVQTVCFIASLLEADGEVEVGACQEPSNTPFGEIDQGWENVGFVDGIPAFIKTPLYDISVMGSGFMVTMECKFIKTLH